MKKARSDAGLQPEESRPSENGTLQSVAVFCGSSPGARAIYAEAAEELGRTLAEAGLGVVYGGASIGLMGRVADAALAAGGEVIGVIPEALTQHEIAKRDLTELIVTKDMHERKATMARLSDAFLALPGGFGTLEELTEILTWAQLGMHRKPAGVLNTAGFFDPLFSFFDSMQREGFLKDRHRALLLSAKTPGELLQKLRNDLPSQAGEEPPPFKLD